MRRPFLFADSKVRELEQIKSVPRGAKLTESKMNVSGITKINSLFLPSNQTMWCVRYYRYALPATLARLSTSQRQSAATHCTPLSSRSTERTKSEPLHRRLRKLQRPLATAAWQTQPTCQNLLTSNAKKKQSRTPTTRVCSMSASMLHIRR